MEQVRWGILSTARIGVRRLLPALARSERHAVRAIASRDLSRARQLATQFGIPRAYGSYEELLEDPDVEAIYNPLPNTLHRPWTLRAAAAGKHVLCEKPLALNADDAAEMVEAGRNAGILLQEAFMYRFHPQIDALRQRVAGGAIGPVWLVRSAFTFTVTSETDIRLNPALGGGGLMDVGCYCVNISRLLLGEPESVWAVAAYERVDVRLAGMLRFPAGASALIDCGVRAPARQFAEIVGTDGTITLPRPFQPEEDPAVILVRRGREEERIEIPGTNQYTLMLDHFAECVRGIAAPRYPAEDAVANMRVLDTLAQSATTGQTVRLRDGIRGLGD